MKPLQITDCGEGVNLDLPASELPPNIWSGGSNVRFRNKFARKRRGFIEAFTALPEVAIGVFIYITATARFVVATGIAGVYVDDGSTQTEITGTPYTGSLADRWTGGDFNGTLVLNNGIDPPQFWNGDIGTDLADLTGWPANHTAQTICPFKDFIFAGNIFDGTSQYPQSIMWSAAAQPGTIPTTWTAAATNNAGDDPFSGIGAVVDFLPLGDTLIAYGQSGRVAIQYVGGNDVFRFVRLPGTDGLLARGCAVATPKGHVFLSNGDVMLHNGGEAVSIAEGVVRDYLRDRLEPASSGFSFLCVNPQEKEVWVVFPEIGEEYASMTLSWSWESGKWNTPFPETRLYYGTYGLISPGFVSSWDADSEEWDQDVTSWQADPNLSNQERMVVAAGLSLGIAEASGLDWGSPFSWHLEKRGISLGDTDTLKIISKSRPHFHAVAGTQIAVKHASTLHPSDEPVFNNSTTYTVGTSTFANQFATAGRYAAIRYEGLDDQTMALRSYDIEFANSGARF